MGDMGDTFRDLKEANKKRKNDNLSKANLSNFEWNRHTRWHWSIILNGKRLDYWPSTKKFQYENRIMVGGIDGFIKKRLEWVNDA